MQMVGYAIDLQTYMKPTYACCDTAVFDNEL
jgi:hypothetical protein